MWPHRNNIWVFWAGRIVADFRVANLLVSRFVMCNLGLAEVFRVFDKIRAAQAQDIASLFHTRLKSTTFYKIGGETLGIPRSAFC